MMKTRVKLIVIILLISPAAFSQLLQRKDKAVYAWASAGLWFPYTDKFNSLTGVNASLNASLNQRYFVEFFWEGAVVLDDIPLPREIPDRVLKLNNKSLLFGIGKYNFKSMALIGYLGISHGNGLYRGKFLGKTAGFVSWSIFEEENFNYWGIPIHVKTLFAGPIAGFSIDLYYNIHHHSDYGLVLNANIGWIRNRGREKEIER